MINLKDKIKNLNKIKNLQGLSWELPRHIKTIKRTLHHEKTLWTIHGYLRTLVNFKIKSYKGKSVKIYLSKKQTKGNFRLE